MTIEEWLKKSIKILNNASIPTAKLDAEVLLSDKLDKDRSWIHSHPENILHEEDLCILDEQIKRRKTHEPLAYVRGRQEFYGRNFAVSPDTLTPRPETETLIDLAIEQVNRRQFTEDSQLQIIDVGTGSGCIIITAALELAKLSTINYQLSFLGLDISESALKIAEKNAKKLKAKVRFEKFDLLSDSIDFISSDFNLILANLPYVPTDFEINLAASHEPGFAIYGGKDGLDYYRQLFTQLSKPSVDSRQITVITESLPPQHIEMESIANESGFEVIKAQDFIQVFESLGVRG
jgi:release factor glutamine methyltransferase